MEQSHVLRPVSQAIQLHSFVAHCPGALPHQLLKYFPLNGGKFKVEESASDFSECVIKIIEGESVRVGIFLDGEGASIATSGTQFATAINEMRSAVVHSLKFAAFKFDWYAPEMFENLLNHCRAEKKVNHRVVGAFHDTDNGHRCYSVNDSACFVFVDGEGCGQASRADAVEDERVSMSFSFMPNTYIKQRRAGSLPADELFTMSPMAQRLAARVLPDYELRQCAKSISKLANQRGGSDQVFAQLRSELGKKSSHCNSPLRTRLRRRRLWA